jgi:hypothetical protein
MVGVFELVNRRECGKHFIKIDAILFDDVN